MQESKPGGERTAGIIAAPRADRKENRDWERDLRSVSVMSTQTVRKPKRSRQRRGVIRVGTASWSDHGFIEDWYPSDLPARKRLPWYADHFNLVEVNSSFYAVPSATAVARWCVRRRATSSSTSSCTSSCRALESG